MQFDYGRLSLRFVSLTAAVLVACRSGAPAGSRSDSSNTSKPTDSAPAASASTTTRSDSVVLRTDKSQYRAGENVTLTFENKSAKTYAFNPCTRSLERESSAGWEALPDEGRMCTMEAWILDPHGTRTGPTELPGTMTPGRYRVVVRMTVEQAGDTPTPAIAAVSDPITVS